MIRELSGPELSLIEQAVARLHRGSALPSVSMDGLVIEMPDGEVVNPEVAEEIARAVLERIENERRSK